MLTDGTDVPGDDAGRAGAGRGGAEGLSCVTAAEPFTTDRSP